MTVSRRRSVEDFEAILRAISKQQEPVILVGGHAVNVWALAYRDRLGSLLAPLQPLTSGDMDVYGTRHALMELHRELGGKLLLSGPREIIDGTLILGTKPNTRELDVLRRVNGIPKIESQSTVTMDVCGYEILVLFPHLLLQAKLENALHLDQSGRQDIKHVKIMMLVLREFLVDVVTGATSENEKSALALLQEVLQVLTSDNAREFTHLHHVGFDGIMPTDLLRHSPLSRLVKFARYQLHRAFPA